jgi:hypothetical protein
MDLLALREAIYKGTIKPEDRATLERILPGVCAQIEAQKAETLRTLA